MVAIPEELTNEILRYAFRIYPADVFTDSHDKPHEPHHRAPRPKRLLLVCKQWHRIGTPYLYETVEITCDDDMKRLMNTLQSSAPPRDRLASMVRNLRIDGGYGRDLLTVAKLTNNVRVLSVQLRTFSKYPTGGLARALACLNPAEVYLHGLGQRQETKKAESNTQILLRAIPGWTALRKISFIHIGWRPLTLPPELLTTLSSIPNLQIGGDRRAIDDLLDSPPFHVLVRKANVPTIICYGADRCLRRNLKAFRDVIPEDVSGLLVYEETQRVLNDRAFHEAMEEMDKDDDLRARIGLPPYKPPPVRDSEDSDTDSLLGYF